MNLLVRENPWRLMLAVNVAVLIGVFLYKLTREPYVPYIHLLVDYHFGRQAVLALLSEPDPFAKPVQAFPDHAPGVTASSA